MTWTVQITAALISVLCRGVRSSIPQSKSAMKRQRHLVLALVLLIGSLLAWWWQASTSRPVRIALLPFTTVNDRVMSGFKAALREQGWIEGQHVVYRDMPADGAVDKLDARMAELMAWKPTLVLAMSTPPSQAAHRATKTSETPLIFAPATDPLAAGLVASLARPGAHVSGIRLLPSNGLRLEYLQLIAPAVRVVYVPYHSEDRSAQSTLEQIAPTARARGLELLLRPIDGADDLKRAASEIPAEAQAVFLPQDSRIEAAIDLFVQEALKRRLPLSAPGVIQVEQGALMTYGFDHTSIGRQAARLAASVLAGTPIGSLPVEAAENGLYINLRTAHAIGLKVDDGLLRQARGVLR